MGEIGSTLKSRNIRDKTGEQEGKRGLVIIPNIP